MVGMPKIFTDFATTKDQQSSWSKSKNTFLVDTRTKIGQVKFSYISGALSYLPNSLSELLCAGISETVYNVVL